MKPWSHDWLIAAGAYPGFCSMKRLGVFLLNRMLVHRRSLHRNLLGFPQQFAGTHLYSCVMRGTVGVKCLTQEHNTVSPARARTRAARPGNERTNHEATAPPPISSICTRYFFICVIHQVHYRYLPRGLRRFKGARLWSISRLNYT